MSITRLGNLPIEAAAYWLATQINPNLKNKKLSLVILPDMQTAMSFSAALEFFLDANQTPLLHFPDWEILPYDRFSPHEDLISERLNLLNKLPGLTHGIVTITIQTALQKLAPKEHILGQSFDFKIGQKFNISQTRQRLERSGYTNVSQVERKGEYAIRGEIFDVYPMGSNQPYRIDLFDDEIESIKNFDIETQRSGQSLPSIHLLPAREYPQDPDNFSLCCENLIKTFGDRVTKSTVYQALAKKQIVSGLEAYLPLFFKDPVTQPCSFLDYCPDQTDIILINSNSTFGSIDQQAQNHFEAIKARYESVRYDLDRPALSPEQLYFSHEGLFKLLKIKNFDQTKITCDSTQPSTLSQIKNCPPLFIQTHSTQPWENLQKFLKNYPNHKIIFTAESEGRREVLKSHFQKMDWHPNYQASFLDAQNSQKNSLSIAPILHGFIQEAEKWILIAEGDLFQNITQLKRDRTEKSKIKAEEAAVGIYDLTELTPGLSVVHITHGIGKYIGLQSLNINDHVQDFITLEYAQNNKLYVPISQMRLISRYSSSIMDHPSLSNLGTATWEKALEKAEQRIYDTAADLLAVYAKRATLPGLVYELNEEDYLRFSADFPFEETPDQTLAIQAIIKDMQSKKPMDRLLCGDVGFGKTEVAMRAAFIAVQNNKQVAILVPTTLLANQHFQSFSDRFAHWPIHIEMMSRFRSDKETKEAIKKIQAGQIDIIIGTHKLLSHLVEFKDLGLVVIDEEHRFGVRDKEKLKVLRSEVDMLAMTATPIPRTLNLSLSRVRDLSIIATPPKKRLSIKTFVLEKQEGLLREAILRETLRGGQVYFLHNDVQTIQLTQQELQKILPQISFGIAHGQLPERELERVMSDFYHARFQVLICTTIIETGIDIPNANTIIMDRADHLGLAQLHQLRGRVGRSHHQAYAYLLTPPWKSLTQDAQRRLEAIIETKELGSGLVLASHDLEIRGAGEILGEEQSGHIQQIGFSLYMELLDQAIKSLEKGEPAKINFENFRKTTEVDLGESAIIPAEFIPDVSMRLYFYRKLSQIKNPVELEDIQVELIDRFGLLPEPAKLLFEQTRIKFLAENLGITQIKAGKSFAKIEFSEKTPVQPIQIIKLLQSYPSQYKMAGPKNLSIQLDGSGSKGTIKILEKFMGQLSKS